MTFERVQWKGENITPMIFLVSTANTTIAEMVYSSVLTTNSPTYSPTACSTSNHYYEALQLGVVTSGPYRFSCNSSIALHGSIYQGAFHPSAPSVNRLVEKTGEEGFRLRVHLQSKTTYVLVVTSMVSNQTGSFSIDATGPNSIDASRIGKF